MNELKKNHWLIQRKNTLIFCPFKIIFSNFSQIKFCLFSQKTFRNTNSLNKRQKNVRLKTFRIFRQKFDFQRNLMLTTKSRIRYQKNFFQNPCISNFNTSKAQKFKLNIIALMIGYPPISRFTAPENRPILEYFCL